MIKLTIFQSPPPPQDFLVVSWWNVLLDYITNSNSFLDLKLPPYLFLHLCKWPVFGSTPLPYFSFFNYSKGYVRGHHSSLFFFLRLLRFPPYISFFNYSSGSCLGAPSPSFFFFHSFKLAMFGSIIPLYFSCSNHKSELCSGGPSPSVFFLHLFK